MLSFVTLKMSFNFTNIPIWTIDFHKDIIIDEKCDECNKFKKKCKKLTKKKKKMTQQIKKLKKKNKKNKKKYKIMTDEIFKLIVKKLVLSKDINKYKFTKTIDCVPKIFEKTILKYCKKNTAWLVRKSGKSTILQYKPDNDDFNNSARNIFGQDINLCDATGDTAIKDLSIRYLRNKMLIKYNIIRKDNVLCLVD